MPIKLACGSCETKLSVKDELAGRSIKCPKCTTLVKVPGNTPTVAKTAAPTRQNTPAPPSKKPAPAPAPGASRSNNSAVSKVSKVSKPKPKPPVDDLPEEELDEVDDKGREVRKDGLDLDLEWEIPEKYKDQIKDELSKGEKLLWCGQPSRRIIFIRSLIYAIMGVLFMLGGLIFGLVFAFSGGRNAGFAAALMPLLIGLGVGGSFMLALPWNLFKAGRTCYALTSRRCIVWRCEWYGGVSMTNYSPAQLVGMFRRDMWLFGKGGGDVVFKTLTVITTTTHRTGRGGYGGTSTSMQTYYYGFIAIENCRAVEKLVREALVDRLVDKMTY